MEKAGREIMYSVFRIQKALYRLVREDATRVGITEVQLIVLYTLFKKENIRLNDLAEKLNMSNSTVSGTIDRLVSAGLVMRETSREDRRAVTLRLTEKGREKLIEAFNHESVLVQRLRKIENEIEAADIEKLLSIHQTIKDILLGEE
ncbi:MarR family winged helix-turn-helix transcriptional regulator [Thermaerobacillus caldiproteolyticus]|uniref:DNA-binding MarR family transcriptional regulator n=1 Tax=Thermaerobacillus caldiproteolyticus TaxID=247480 RepID=A0A7V9Z7B3_9BACL|nr:MarR family transcriptional regulator [Anoxybacillus caldiproteolyticus]MBA2875359.1 DNA-binding MarR family transcriptional regulator [Anoxybacillus caldiproteolyticus]QPA32658.1 MarR family transcriptional regulator [Anoxybacillus caldiproteolyticus]